MGQRLEQRIHQQGFSVLRRGGVLRAKTDSHIKVPTLYRTLPPALQHRAEQNPLANAPIDARTFDELVVGILLLAPLDGLLSDVHLSAPLSVVPNRILLSF